MLIYHYNPTTGQFHGSSEAAPNPLEPGQFLIPAHATPSAPPAVGANQSAAWKNGAWTVVPDYVGVTLFKPDGTKAPDLNFGDSPDPSWATTPPPDASGDYTHSGGSWARDAGRTLARRSAEVDVLYAAKIDAGFPYYGKVIQMDAQSQSDVQAAVLQAQVAGTVPAGFSWRCLDNTFLPLATTAELVAMATAAFGWIYALKQAAWTRKDAMKVLPADQMAAYDIGAGW